MVVVAVDFKKAQDSIKREKLMEVLKDMKLPMEMIDLIKRGYDGDRTRTEVGNGNVMMDINSGIRQGCTASPLLLLQEG